MPFLKLDEMPQNELLPGFQVRFVHAERMTLAYWTIAKDARLPEHSHHHEQVCNVLEGEFELTIDGESRRLGAGDVGVIPSNAVHSGRALSDCKVMDVFHPVRDDYREPAPAN